MKRITLIIIVLVLFAFVMTGCGDKWPVTGAESEGADEQIDEQKEVQESDETEPSDGEEQEKRRTWIDDMHEEFEQKVVYDTEELLTVPIYEENSVLYGGWPDTFYVDIRLGRDTSVVEESTVYRQFKKRFPDCAIRGKEDGSYYAVIETDSGKRMYLFYDKSDRLIPQMGYTLVLDRTILCRNDYAGICIGSTISDVKSIDSITGIYQYIFMDIYGATPERTRGNAAYAPGWVFSSVHYLSDGILVFDYADMNENNELIVTDIHYAEDYTLMDCKGREINYWINPIDYP